MIIFPSRRISQAQLVRKAAGFDFKGMPGPDGLARRWRDLSWEHCGATGWHQGWLSLPWPPSPWGHPPTHQQEGSSSPKPSCPVTVPCDADAHTCAPDRAHKGCSVLPGRWQQGGKRRILGIQTPKSRQKNLTLAGGHGGTYSTDLAQPQPPPAEGKSHFFPDSSINYRAENPSGGNCQHCSSKLQLSWWLHRALQCVTRLATPVPAWHQGHSSAGGVGQGRE